MRWKITSIERIDIGRKCMPVDAVAPTNTHIAVSCATENRTLVVMHSVGSGTEVVEVPCEAAKLGYNDDITATCIGTDTAYVVNRGLEIRAPGHTLLSVSTVGNDVIGFTTDGPIVNNVVNTVIIENDTVMFSNARCFEGLCVGFGTLGNENGIYVLAVLLRDALGVVTLSIFNTLSDVSIDNNNDMWTLHASVNPLSTIAIVGSANYIYDLNIIVYKTRNRARNVFAIGSSRVVTTYSGILHVVAQGKILAAPVRYSVMAASGDTLFLVGDNEVMIGSDAQNGSTQISVVSRSADAVIRNVDYSLSPLKTVEVKNVYVPKRRVESGLIDYGDLTIEALALTSSDFISTPKNSI